MDRALDVAWITEPRRPGDHLAFGFANTDAAYLTGDGRLVRFDHRSGERSDIDVPPGSDVATLCGAEDDAAGIVAALSRWDPSWTAEPEGDQTYARARFSRLEADGSWTEIPPSPSWNPEAPVLNGRCVGSRPTLLDPGTADLWVLGDDDRWENWGPVVEDYDPDTMWIEGDWWVVTSREWASAASPAGVVLHSADTTLAVELPPSVTELQPVWGVVLPDGEFVGQFHDEAAAADPVMVRAEVPG